MHPQNSYRIWPLFIFGLAQYLICPSGWAQDATAKPVHKTGAQQVTADVTAWARAWSAQDADAYLAYYAPDFRVPGKQTRQAWEKTRRRQLGVPKFLEVRISHIEVEMLDAATAWVRFTQAYRADGAEEKTDNVLWLKKRDGRWKITREARVDESSASGSPAPDPAQAMQLDIAPSDKPPPASAPRALGTGSISGKIKNDAAVRKVVMTQQRPIQYVYRRELKYNPNLRGTVMVRLTIQADGRVIKAKILRDSVKSKALARFIERFARSWQIALKEPRAFTTDLTLMFVPPQPSKLR